MALPNCPLWNQAKTYFKQTMAADNRKYRRTSARGNNKRSRPDPEPDQASSGFDLETATKLYLQKGGWEIWLQCAFALWLGEQFPGKRVRREMRIWQNSQDSCDLVFSDTADDDENDTHEGPKAGVLIELKCERQPDLDNPKSGPALVKEWQIDINKFLKNKIDAGSEFAVYYPLALVVWLHPQTKDALEEAVATMQGDGDYSTCAFHSETAQTGGYFVCMPYVPADPDNAAFLAAATSLAAARRLQPA